MGLLSVLELQQRLLTRLSVWSAVSVGAGGILLLWFPPQSFWGAFGGMNAVRGIINLVIASLGFFGVLRKMRLGLDDEQRERSRLRKLLLVNTYLDVVYVAVGIGLVVFGGSPLLQGFGWGVVVQGGFLLLLDGWYYRQGGNQ